MTGLEALEFQVINGLVWSVFVALIALGLNAIYGLLGVLNMAHGSLYAWGAILGWLIAGWSGSFWVAFALAPLAAAVLSVPIYFLVLRHTVGKELMISLLATAGLMFILDDGALALIGGTPRALASPIHGVVAFAGVFYPLYRFVAMAIAGLILVLFWTFLYSSRLGLWVRCVAQGHELARASGVPVERVYLLIVCMGSFFAALAGVLAAPMTLVHYSMGLAVLGPAFIVIVVGGLGSLPGAMLVAVIIGVGRGLLTVVLPPTYADVFAVLALLPLLLIRPHGLFGSAV